MKQTKKAFREALNEKYGFDIDRRGSLTGARTRKYGDWLYSADKEVFDITYKIWIETGEL